MPRGFALLESIFRKSLDDFQEVAHSLPVAGEQVFWCDVGQRNILEIGGNLVQQEAEIAAEVRFALRMPNNACGKKVAS